jgi:hypothetical protein
MDVVNKFLKGTLKQTELYFGYVLQERRPYVKCKDGFGISIQASDGHYCTPRVNGDVIYEEVELGYPNMEDELIAEYAEDPDDLTDTVYGWVPVDIVNQLIEKHGGIVESNEEET